MPAKNGSLGRGPEDAGGPPPTPLGGGGGDFFLATGDGGLIELDDVGTGGRGMGGGGLGIGGGGFSASSRTDNLEGGGGLAKPSGIGGGDAVEDV